MNIIQQYFFSDESTQWSTYDDNTQSYYYYDGNTELNWTDNPANGLPADIYYNKKGFNEEYSIKSDSQNKTFCPFIHTQKFKSDESHNIG